MRELDAGQWPPIPFTKMHGLGNDYLYIDLRFGTVPTELPWSAVAQAMSDRHFGAGADGIILIAASEVADARMRILNADGSESEMCGNGLRALAKWLFDRGLAGARQRIQTGAGILQPEVVEVDSAGRARLIRVNMGRPQLTAGAIGLEGLPPDAPAHDLELEVLGERLRFTGVSMGNPHAIFFGPLWDQRQLETWGPAIERHPRFPRRINVHAVTVEAPDHLRMVHWERGAGRTLACGTGAAAALVAAAASGRTARAARIDVPGGSLRGEWDPADDAVYLVGPAQEVYQGVFQPR